MVIQHTCERSEARLASTARLVNLSSAMQTFGSTRSSVLEPPGSKAAVEFDAKRKQELGQFLTPETIGSFIASLFEAHPVEIRLLDAGA